MYRCALLSGQLMEKWRLLDIEIPDSAHMNMAIDEAVFIKKMRNQMQPTTLRLWRNKCAVAIGRFQSIEKEINKEICLPFLICLNPWESEMIPVKRFWQTL